jgi:hypothetical protein
LPLNTEDITYLNSCSLFFIEAFYT